MEIAESFCVNKDLVGGLNLNINDRCILVLELHTL